MYISIFNFAKISIKISGYLGRLFNFSNVYSSIFNICRNFDLLHKIVVIKYFFSFGLESMPFHLSVQKNRVILKK